MCTRRRSCSTATRTKAAQEQSIDVGEVDREERVGLRGQELSPGRPGPTGARGRVRGSFKVFQTVEDLPDGRGARPGGRVRSVHPDSVVAPAGILAGHPQYQGSDRRCGGWPAWSSVRVGPAPGDELGVPAQQRSGRDQPQLAQRGRNSLLSALSTARSRHVSASRVLVRRSTATSCAASGSRCPFAASERASSSNQLSTRTSIR